MGQIGATCSQCIQFLSIPEQQRVSIRFDVQQRSNHPSSKVVRTKTEVLQRKKQCTEDGYVEQIVHNHGGQHLKSKGKEAKEN